METEELKIPWTEPREILLVQSQDAAIQVAGSRSDACCVGIVEGSQQLQSLTNMRLVVEPVVALGMGAQLTAVLESLGLRRSLAEQGPRNYMIPAANGVINRLATKVADGHCSLPTPTRVPKQLRYINATPSDPGCCHRRVVE